MYSKIESTHIQSSRYSTGFTLIELMVYMVIATAMISAGIMLFKNSSAQRNTLASKAELHQESFLASHILSQQFAQIGYRQIDRASVSGRIMPLESKDTAYPEVANEWLAGQVVKGAADSLSFRFQGASGSDLSADATIFDCSGNAVPAGTVQESQLIFQNNQLQCSTAGETNVLLGINDTIDLERVLFVLGVDDDGDGAIDRHVQSSASTASDFVNTRQITAKLLMASSEQVAVDTQPYRFNHQELTPTDRKMRLETEVTVMLRN